MKTGCSSLEALYAMRHPLCPERIAGTVERIRGISNIPPYPLIFGDCMDECKNSHKICYLVLGEPCALYDDYLLKLEERV